ncbi:LytR/AlgR family response regulator transcription factor [Aquimarina aquimarini]|uniref:LytR/AlgR family response regulator transcription factor n=1 Tax=Aquimarina aquimarini TaxID=1191734 RepID=UPI000D557472|nr:LytTR family DNA-binding domain-containing protein [Aquimarina aquimarini]
MKCFLIGENRNLLENIEAYLQANFFYIRAYEKTNSYKEGEKMLQKVKPDLVLLDITVNLEIPFDLLKKIKKYTIDHLVIIPNDKEVINFLKKEKIISLTTPLDYEELQLYINTFYINKTKEIELQQILSRIHNKVPKTRIAIPQEKQIQMVSLRDIIYIEADVNYCQIHIHDKKPMCVSKTLKSFEEQLINNNEFYRIHQSYLINLNYINKVIKTKLPQVIMTNGDILPISRSKKVDFLKLILG